MEEFVIVDEMGRMGRFRGSEQVVLALRIVNEAGRFALLISYNQDTGEG